MLTPAVEAQLATISRATVQRLLQRFAQDTPRLPRRKPMPPNRLLRDVPMERLSWATTAPGSFETDLVQMDTMDLRPLPGLILRQFTSRDEEFWQCYDGHLDMPTAQAALLAWEQRYNTVRPHQALDYLTPQQFLDHWHLARMEQV